MSQHQDDSAALNKEEFEPLLDLRKAAALLGMHWKTLEVMAREERIPAFRIGGRWRFRASLLNEWLQKMVVRRGGNEVQWNQPVALRETKEWT